MRRLCQHTVPALSATALACALLVALLPTLNSHFLPPLREGHYILHTTGLPGASLTESIRLGTRLSGEIRAVPGGRSVSQWAGRAARGADTYGPHYSEYEIALDPMAGRAQQTLLDRIRRIVARFPGVRGEVNTFLIERVDETIAGYAAPVVVNIYGHDFAALDLLARQVNQLMTQIEGAAEVQTRAAAQAPVLQVDLVPAQFIQHGVLARDALLVMQTAYNGHPIGTVLADDRPLDLVLTAPADSRRETAAQTLPVTALDGNVLPLGALVTTTEVDGRYNILHRGGLRVQTVTANVTRRALSAYWAELARRLKTEITVPSEMKLELTGAAVEAARARTQLLVDSMLAGCGVLALIAIALGRFRYVVMVLANLPFALAGGVIAVVVTQGTLSIGSVVGFVTLFGITVRNSIMLIAHYTHLVQVEGRPWSLDTVVQGAAERLPSIAITALVTALAMLPIALNSDNAGREIMGPMAAIIIGGLVSSAILNLLIMPALMWRFGRFDVDRRRISTP